MDLNRMVMKKIILYFKKLGDKLLDKIIPEDSLYAQVRKNVPPPSNKKIIEEGGFVMDSKTGVRKKQRMTGSSSLAAHYNEIRREAERKREIDSVKKHKEHLERERKRERKRKLHKEHLEREKNELKMRLPGLSKIATTIFPGLSIRQDGLEIKISYPVGNRTRNLKYSNILSRGDDSIKKEMMKDYEGETEWEKWQSVLEWNRGSDSSPKTCLRCGYRTSSSYSVRSYNGRKVCSTCNDSMSDW